MAMKDENLRLRDPEVVPSSEVLAEVLGGSYRAYEEFQHKLAELEIEHYWKYYPSPMCGKCWLAQGKYRWTTPRGTKKEKNLYWSSAWDKYFVVAIWFKEDNRAEILNSNVSEETKSLIRAGKMFGPKMRTFPVEFEIRDSTLLVDICTLLKYKIKLEA